MIAPLLAALFNILLLRKFSNLLHTSLKLLSCCCICKDLASSAQAKWVIRLMFFMPKVLSRSLYADIISSGKNPSLCIPVSILNQIFKADN